MAWTALHKCSEKSNQYSLSNSAPPAWLIQMSFWKALEKQSGTSSLLTAEHKFLKTTEKPAKSQALALKVFLLINITMQCIKLWSDPPLRQGLFIGGLDLQRDAETLSCPIDHSNPWMKHKGEHLQLYWDVQSVIVYLGVSTDLFAFIEQWA